MFQTWQASEKGNVNFMSLVHRI